MVPGQAFEWGPRRDELRLRVLLPHDAEILEPACIFLCQLGDCRFGGGRGRGNGSSRRQGSIPISLKNCPSPYVISFLAVMTYIGWLDPSRGFLRKKLCSTLLDGTAGSAISTGLARSPSGRRSGKGSHFATALLSCATPPAADISTTTATRF